MSQGQQKTDRALHDAEVESLERRLMELALSRTGADNGGIFLWDGKKKALVLDFHVVDRRVVTLPGTALRRRTDGRPNGIAFHVFDTGEPYACRDATEDPHYARYFLEVRSIAAVPIPWQDKPIGVLSVSAREPGVFNETHLAELEALARSAAKFLRRAQLFRSSGERGGRPFLIKGMSPEWEIVERQIEHVSPTDAPVLVHGESGTGKELVANAIHFNSKRSGGPFVTVNCAAIPDTMLESILFGHVRGAFTGASFEKIGEFQKADKGTLFLDEIGELPLLLQAKVLRAAELGEVQPLGSNAAPKRIDVRLVCATHRDLAAMVRAREFRDDLYYRLSVMTIELPPLRSYKADNIEVLVETFVQQAAQRLGRPTPRVSPAALALVAAYDYPGNVRELKNALEHAVIMARGGEIELGDLPRTMRGEGVPVGEAVLQSTARVAEARGIYRSVRSSPPPPSRPEHDVEKRTLREVREAWLAPLETEYFRALLAASGGNVREASRRAGVDPVTLYRLLKKRGVRIAREVLVSKR